MKAAALLLQVEARLRAARLPWAAADLLRRDRQGGLDEAGAVSANGSCHIISCQDGAVALNLARPDDWDMLPAMMHGAGDDLAALRRFATGQTVGELAAQAMLLQLPVARWAEAAPLTLAEPVAAPSLRGVRVVDMSALWAGPLCGALLAEAGAIVTRIHSIGRPDPTEQHSPHLFERLHHRKHTLALDLRRDADRAALLDHIASADVLISSARPAALARLGLEVAALSALNPKLIWCAITAHGFAGDAAMRVGFGDDCAFAGGLGEQTEDGPRFMGDALADPLTGLEAALAVMAACEEGKSGLLDMAMSRVAASYAARLAATC